MTNIIMQEWNQYNKYIQRHGYWEWNHTNGQLWYKGIFINGIKDGHWESYYSDGKLCYKGNYTNGDRHGYWIDFGKEYYYARM